MQNFSAMIKCGGSNKWGVGGKNLHCSGIKFHDHVSNNGKPASV